MTFITTPPFVLKIQFCTCLDYNKNPSHAVRIFFPPFVAMPRLFQNHSSRFGKTAWDRHVVKDTPETRSRRFAETRGFSLKKFTSDSSAGHMGLLWVYLLQTVALANFGLISHAFIQVLFLPWHPCWPVQWDPLGALTDASPHILHSCCSDCQGEIPPKKAGFCCLIPWPQPPSPPCRGVSCLPGTEQCLPAGHRFGNHCWRATARRQERQHHTQLGSPGIFGVQVGFSQALFSYAHLSVLTVALLFIFVASLQGDKQVGRHLQRISEWM